MKTKKKKTSLHNAAVPCAAQTTQKIKKYIMKKIIITTINVTITGRLIIASNQHFFYVYECACVRCYTFVL